MKILIALHITKNKIKKQKGITVHMFKKADLVAKVATKTEVTKKEAERFVDAYIDSVKDLIMDENENGLEIHGFEKYEVKTVPPRNSRNPRTGEAIVTEETVRCKTTLSKKIKNLEY